MVRKMIFLACLLVLVACIPLIASAQTYTVNPGDNSLDNAVNNLHPGDTIILNAGVYRKEIDIPTGRNWSGNTPTTIKAATGATVTIKGSNVVSGWVSQGSNVWLKSSWTTNSQQVFVNGTRLQQIGGEIFKEDPNIYFPTDPNHSLSQNQIENGGI